MTEPKVDDKRLKQVQQRKLVFKARREHVLQVSASLGVIAALIGSGLLSVLLSPQWADLSSDPTKPKGYCTDVTSFYIGGTTNPASLSSKASSSCEAWREFFWITATLSFALTCCTLLLSFAAVYGFDNLLRWAFGSFWLSLCSLSLSIIATSWIVYTAVPAITATVLMSILAILTVIIIAPTAMWTSDLTRDKKEIETCQIQWSEGTLKKLKPGYEGKIKENTLETYYDPVKLSGGDVIHFASSKAGGHIDMAKFTLFGGFRRWCLESSPCLESFFKNHPNFCLLHLVEKLAASPYRKWNRWYYYHLAKLLLASGVDPDQTFGDEDVSPILLVFQTNEGEKINLNLARVLLQAGVNANSKDNRGLSLLWKAVHRNEPKLVDLLLNYGANPNEQYINTEYNPARDSPLHLAVRVEAGLKKGPKSGKLEDDAAKDKEDAAKNDEDPSKDETDDNITPIKAVKGGICEISTDPENGQETKHCSFSGKAEELHEDDIETKNEACAVLIDREKVQKTDHCIKFYRFWQFIQNAFSPSLEFIQRHFSGLVQLLKKILKGRPEASVIGVLITHGADPNALNAMNASPLYVATMMNSKCAVESLLTSANTKIKLYNPKPIKEGDCDKDGPKTTILHSAVKFDKEEAVKALLEHRHDQDDEEKNAILKKKFIDQVDEDQNVALHYATSPEIVDLLLAHGADPNKKDAEGKLPIEIAVSGDYDLYQDEEIEDIAMDILKVYAKYKVKLIEPTSPKRLSDIAKEKNRRTLSAKLIEMENREEGGTQRQLDSAFIAAGSLGPSGADGTHLQKTGDDENV